VTPHIYPDAPGGLALGVHEAACKLADQFEITVASTWMSSKDLPNDLPYRLIAFPSRSNIAGNPISPLLWKWVRQNVRNYDLIHLHSHLFLISLRAAAAGWVSSKPMVLTNHGMISLSFPRSLQLVWTKLALHTVLGNCNLFLCYTKSDAMSYAKLGASLPRIIVIPYGIDLDEFQFTDHYFNGPLRLLWLGRVVPDKGLRDLLYGLSEIGDASLSIRLSIYGEGPALERLVLLAEDLGLGGVVSFFPYVPHEMVPTIMAQHDALVLPSLTEGLPRIALEAFATGLPVLCSKLSQLVEAFGTSVTYFQPNSPASIRAALLDANSNRSQLARNATTARNLVERKYSIDAFAAHLGDLYRQVLAEATGGETTKADRPDR